MSRLRYSLADTTVQASTLLGSWARIPDIVVEKDVVDLIKNGGRRVGERAHEEDSDVEVLDGPPPRATTQPTQPVAGPSGTTHK